MPRFFSRRRTRKQQVSKEEETVPSIPPSRRKRLLLTVRRTMKAVQERLPNLSKKTRLVLGTLLGAGIIVGVGTNTEVGKDSAKYIHQQFNDAIQLVSNMIHGKKPSSEQKPSSEDEFDEQERRKEAEAGEAKQVEITLNKDNKEIHPYKDDKERKEIYNKFDNLTKGDNIVIHSESKDDSFTVMDKEELKEFGSPVLKLKLNRKKQLKISTPGVVRKRHVVIALEDQK